MSNSQALGSYGNRSVDIHGDSSYTCYHGDCCESSGCATFTPSKNLSLNTSETHEQGMYSPMSFGYVYQGTDGIIVAADTRRSIMRNGFAYNYFDDEEKIVYFPNTHTYLILTGTCRFGDSESITIQNLTTDIDTTNFGDMVKILYDRILAAHPHGEFTLNIFRYVPVNEHITVAYHAIRLNSNCLSQTVFPKTSLDAGNWWCQSEDWACKYCESFLFGPKSVDEAYPLVINLMRAMASASANLPIAKQTIGKRISIYKTQWTKTTHEYIDL